MTHCQLQIETMKPLEIVTKRKLHQHNQAFLPLLFHFQSLPEEEGRSVLPVLATIEMRRGKKSVVCVDERVAGLVPVKGSSSCFRICTL